jgi:ribosomal protein L31
MIDTEGRVDRFLRKYGMVERGSKKKAEETETTETAKE